MRIVRIARTLPPLPGGQEIHARELTIRQVTDGARIELIYAAGEPPRGEGIVPHRLRAGLPGTPKRISAQGFAWNVARCRHFIGEEIDVVHAHGDYADAWAALRLADRLGCPSILTVHAGLSNRPVQRALSRYVFPYLSHVIAVSESIRDQLTERGVTRERISVISSGIHFHAYCEASPGERKSIREKLGLATDGPLIVSAGRLHPLKGYRFLIEAYPRVAERFPGVQIAIMGDGPEGSSLRTLASRSSGIHFVGTFAPTRVAELLGAADLFVLPSVNLADQAEGTPTSIMEAMAAGLPVISTRTGGAPQLIRDGVNGLIVAPGDSIALAEAIVRLLSEPVLLRAMGDRNRSDVEGRDWSEVARRVSEVYQEARTTVGRGRHGNC